MLDWRSSRLQGGDPEGSRGRSILRCVFHTLDFRSVILQHLFNTLDLRGIILRCVFNILAFRSIILRRVINALDFISVTLRCVFDMLEFGRQCHVTACLNNHQLHEEHLEACDFIHHRV